MAEVLLKCVSPEEQAQEGERGTMQLTKDRINEICSKPDDS
jgi:hypothetical protein